MDPNANKLISSLDKKEMYLKDVALRSDLKYDQAMRIMFELEKEGYVSVRKNAIEQYRLGEFGKIYVKEPFPEELIANTIKKEMSLAEFNKVLGPKSGFILGYARKNGLVGFVLGGDQKIKLIKKIDSEKYKTYRFLLRKLRDGQDLEKKEIEALKEYPKLIEKALKIDYYITKKKELDIKKLGDSNELTVLKKENIKQDNLKLKKYDVVADVAPYYGGKKQGYLEFLDLIKQKMVELGFQEMESPLVTPEFYNFDVLYQPQNHPARTWTDTYNLDTKHKGEFDEKIAKLVKEAHEKGGISGSKGWGGSWSIDVARKLMPAAHGTAGSAKKMATGVKEGKYFALARVYRPDVVDATHLCEFNQLDGFVIGDNISFKSLLGMLETFAKEVAGAEETMFLPDYYPFTEPSVQLSAKHPKLGWVEFGGAGIFRPEITETLGIKGRVIAWGLGIDRLAMFNLGIKDIRDLFSNNLEMLRKQKVNTKI